MKNGITTTKAVEQLKIHGYNELPSAKPKGIWQIALEVIKEPMFILLLGCGLVYLVLGDYTEGIILLCWVFVIIFITFYQHRKTEKSLEALRQLSSPRTLVIRDGIETRIPGREVVPDDVVILHEGDRVPADVVILESHHLTIDESLLTGESVPVTKNDDTENKAYSGTLVVQGKGLAKVIHTGIKTQLGKIGTSLQTIEEDSTRLQREMKKLIRNLFIGGAIISSGVVTAFYFTRGDILKALLNGLATAMALLPEEFPVVFTIFLALGAWRLSRNKVLTRKTSAIETLGSATVLCSDKTGTITQSKMEMAALYVNQTTYYRGEFDFNTNDIKELLKTLYFASSNNSIDPMEKAIANEYEKGKPTEISFPLVKEYPLSRELFAMTRVYQSVNHSLTAYCKGAPEAVYQLCHLSEAEINAYTPIVLDLAESGFRVLAAAKGSSNNGLPEQQSDFNFSFVGFVAFEDPIRPEVPQAIKECYEAGINVIMITGDYPATAKSIANQIGLQHNASVLTGTDLQQMSEEELKQKIKQTHIFARIVPEQKLQIVKALKANGDIVAMTGDGVNDAPALKAADIGVAMGLKGTDVAREASSLVLLDDNFASIIQAIRSGRRIFDNLQKAMSYIIAIHIPIIGLVLMPAFFSWLPILLMPLHIVFLELIIDPVCAVAFESEQEEKKIMSRPPRKPDALFFGWSKILFSLFKGTLLLGMVIAVYAISIDEGHTDGEIRAIAFSSLIMGNVFLILSSLSDTRNFIAVVLEKNTAVIVISLVAIAILLLTITVPFLKNIFAFEFPGYKHFLPSLIGALVMLLVLELVKYVKPRFGKV
ncbi:cation-translocating P-type ATPase [Flavobacterium sedimenticola]|uniref:Cation-translocating P-type ATPase n=1 Tax=Flavobacterium sedimenticola TaxID=3043286 RepID=A0ABT6XNZ2_9FLAO|nr:cation-translocating P-type ATPase [Flavobacterium sedimenticola]MDI9256810.1 cation-translocating P-type ATPase [Flavobacterium sedimenticola]